MKASSPQLVAVVQFQVEGTREPTINQHQKPTMVL